jgi:hypothetical protein
MCVWCMAPSFFFHNHRTRATPPPTYINNNITNPLHHSNHINNPPNNPPHIQTPPKKTQAVFRAPDLSSSFVEAMDTVVNQLLRVKDQELIDIIADIARDVSLY